MPETGRPPGMHLTDLQRTGPRLQSGVRDEASVISPRLTDDVHPAMELWPRCFSASLSMPCQIRWTTRRHREGFYLEKQRRCLGPEGAWEAGAARVTP